ncbi:MAG: hypothetical protein K2W78_09085 [Xanthobacteraceae bacterium]|nr:hypothetical protein [Xanthobacteraceae bacterium]
MTTPDAAAKAVTSFEEQLQHARELVSEGRRLLHVANRDLRTGTLLVRQSHQRLNDTARIFRRSPPSSSRLN